MPTRRVFLGSLGTLGAAACTTGSGKKASVLNPGPLADPDDDEALEPITPNADFYKVAVSGYIPDQAALDAWTLTIAAEGGAEVVLTAADIALLGGEEQERTLSCIGGSTYRTTGNAKWTAVSVSELLDTLGLNPDASLQWVRFTSGDGYSTSVPRTDLDSGLALATLMNGEPLPPEHGAPIRVLTPGRYGMKNPKWLNRIDFVADFEAGFWESRGWSQDANYQIASWFVTPDDYASVGADGAWVKGIAFAGESGIEMVEVSDDDGLTWTEAEITYPGGPGVWTLWRFLWVPPALGTYSLRVRATSKGTRQAATEVFDGDLDGLEAFDLRTYVAT